MKPEQFQHEIGKDKMDEILDDIETGVIRAESTFPWWPEDVDRGVMIMAEESGEAVKAALQHTWDKRDSSSIRRELIQTAAMCVRAIAHIDIVGDL